MKRLKLPKVYDPDLPPSFMADFVREVRREQTVYAPVTLARMYSWIVARIHSSKLESVLTRAQDRGLLLVETRYSHHKGPKVPPEPYRVLIPK